jgi:two-component system sensor histidine kinase/response regulator
MLKGDAGHIKQVLINLISNAIKFTPEQGHIVVKVELKGIKGNEIKLMFSVSDNGIGIASDEIGKLFEPFEQANRDISTHYGGTGLGLAISKNLVEIMGGTIGVNSQLGQGSNFSFTIPLLYDNNPGKKIKQKIDHLKILTVDDEPETREYITSILNSYHIKSMSVASGSDAILHVINAIAEGHPFDVILIDWKMPEMDGLETARRIREICSKNTIIIIVTAYDWSEISEEAKRLGVSKMIEKPIFPSSLLNAIMENIAMSEIGEPLVSHEMDNIFRGKRILIAEDVAINVEVMREMLANTGIEFDLAVDGEEALQKVLDPANTYDLILMDIQMPKIDGYEVTRKIRQSNIAYAQSLPIIAMTANVFKDDIDLARQAGMNDHLGKPISYDTMISMLSKYLSVQQIGFGGVQS